MAKKQNGGEQIPLIKMTKVEYEHAAVKFADLKIQHTDLTVEKKAKMKRYNDDLTELAQEMQGLAESIKAYEAARE